jgi:catechol 2,3-dioxygenase-like lactoylglutathione lyase family enzyme
MAVLFNTVRFNDGMVTDMKPCINVLTLGVRSVDAARRFYVHGLGWEPTLDVPGEVVFIQIGHGLLLSLYGAGDLAAEAGDIHRGAQAAPISLGYVVADEATVTEILDHAVAAGGSLVAPAQRREWGGVSGYFADPDGYRWEIAYNPGFTVTPEGKVSIQAVAG